MSNETVKPGDKLRFHVGRDSHDGIVVRDPPKHKVVLIHASYTLQPEDVKGKTVAEIEEMAPNYVERIEKIEERCLTND